MENRVIEYAEKHPYIVGGAALAGVLALYLYYNSGSSGGSVAVSSGVDPNVLAYDAQGQALQAQQTGQLNQQAYGLSLAGIQATAAKDQTDTAGAVASLESNNALTATLAQTSAQYSASLAATNAALQASINTNATTANLAQISSAEQLGIAQTNSATVLGLGAQQERTTEAQISGSNYIAGLNTYASVAAITSAANTENIIAGHISNGGSSGDSTASTLAGIATIAAAFL